ncbi:hypothetical protein F2Q69_00002043 [Brassica cretica]|uniref:Uncharacterized protein n=1 Tax=Brassica cretica TaxID=69181 RepID=A0A8S9NME8_BRACR|nr:hypothetical protein F2Q69_00002043 [Brassica cretica]
MTQRGNRNNKKRKTVQYRGMPPGFTPGTRDVPFGPLTADEHNNGKAVVEDEGSDEAPEEFESFSGCSRKGGPCLKRINTLKKPNLMSMSTWTAEEYAKYDAYLIKKWQISGWCDDDSFYVGARDFHSPAAVAARKFHKFERIIHGRIISKPPHNTPLPDLSRMHKWTPHEYDLYDLSLMNKWRISGWDENEATYARPHEVAMAGRCRRRLNDLMKPLRLAARSLQRLIYILWTQNPSNGPLTHPWCSPTPDMSTRIFMMAENMKKTNSMRDLPTPASKTAQSQGKRKEPVSRLPFRKVRKLGFQVYMGWGYFFGENGNHNILPLSRDLLCLDEVMGTFPAEGLYPTVPEQTPFRSHQLLLVLDLPPPMAGGTVSADVFSPETAAMKIYAGLVKTR